jgi:LmbE family N-acetylglucosaminyl deacetylase
VHTLILGEGSSSRFDDPADVDPDDVAARRAASRVAADRLGTEAPVHLAFPDNRFDRVDLLDIVKAVERHVDAIAPSLVLTHHTGDLNVDHQLTARAAITATRPQPGQAVRTVLSFEVPSSTEWAFGAALPPFAPSVFFDVEETLPAKLHALSAYDTELRPFPHPRSPEAIDATAARWGSVAGVRAAEAFQVIRSVR